VGRRKGEDRNALVKESIRFVVRRRDFLVRGPDAVRSAGQAAAKLGLRFSGSPCVTCMHYRRSSRSNGRLILMSEIANSQSRSMEFTEASGFDEIVL